MGRNILTFGNIENEKHKFYRYKNPIFEKMYIMETYKYLIRFFLMQKSINTLLVTCMMIIKLSHCIKYFRKRERI